MDEASSANDDRDRRILRAANSFVGRRLSGEEAGALLSDVEQAIRTAKADGRRISESSRALGEVRTELGEIRHHAHGLARALSSAGFATLFALGLDGSIPYLTGSSGWLPQADLVAFAEELASAARTARVEIVAIPAAKPRSPVRGTVDLQAFLRQLQRMGSDAQISPLARGVVRPSAGRHRDWAPISLVRQCMEVVFPEHLGAEPRGADLHALIGACLDGSGLRRPSARNANVGKLIAQARRNRAEDEAWMRLHHTTDGVDSEVDG